MTATPPDAPKSLKPASPFRWRNGLIALVAVCLSLALFLGLESNTGAGVLTRMAKDSIPLDTALSNNQPTLIEFYADWCTTCQAMAPDLSALKQNYGDRVNFVMLNVDNTRWLPEVLQYRVDGIPHFVFLNAAGDPQTAAIGAQPRAILSANLVALTRGEPLPYTQATGGQTSGFSAAVTPAKTSSSDPRSHSSQTVN